MGKGKIYYPARLYLLRANAILLRLYIGDPSGRLAFYDRSHGSPSPFKNCPRFF